MKDNEFSRLSRLTAILTQLQSKRLITATELSEKFSVSVRTVYRDIRALEEAGVPVCTEEGKGYSLMEGYRLPPVMFTESEANALITAEKLILKNKDASFVKSYSEAITKIKSVLRYETKDKAELLSKRVGSWRNEDSTSNYLSAIQLALTNFNVTEIEYSAPGSAEKTIRKIEPFALYHSEEENWILLAWCRMRKAYRSFRLDRMLKMNVLNDKFEPHTLDIIEYFKNNPKKSLNP